MTDSSTPVEIVRSIVDGIERGDPDLLLRTLSDQVEWNEAESGPYRLGPTFVGRDAILTNAFARLPQDFKDLHLHVHRSVGCGNTVLVEGRETAVAPATGQRLVAQVAHVWDFKDGKVIR